MSKRPGGRGTPRDANRPQRPRLRNQLLFVFGIIMLAGGAFYTALVVATQIDTIFFPDQQIRAPSIIRHFPGIDDRTPEEALAAGGRINILVMGLDRRPREGNAPARTDTMFVMTVDPSTRTARGLAMPRDLYVDIPTKTGNSTFKERINAAYVIGETQNYPGGGIALVKTTVERLLGIKLNYYVLIDFEGFKQVIDLLGGIDVDVPTLVNDPFYSETELPGDYYPCVWEPGLHHMNGSQALCYARVRRNSSDLDRVLRQQRIIFAVMDKATQLNVLTNLDNAVNLYKRYRGAISTDVNDAQVPGFAKLAAAIDPEQLAFLSLGPVTTPFTTNEGAAVLLPSEAGIKMIVDAFISDNRLLQEAAVIEVQNGTGIQDQASKAVEYFTNLGIPNSSLVAVNVQQAGHTRTEIVDFSGKRYTAERLASWLGLPKDRIRTAVAADSALRNSEADIVVLLGTDAKLENTLASPPR